MRAVARWITCLATVAVLVAGAAACGVPTDDHFDVYNADDLPDVLTNTTTTTTTVPPDSTLPVGPAETTSTLAFAGTYVDVFYIVRTSDGIQRFAPALPTPVTDELLIDTLVMPPPEARERGLRSAVLPGLIQHVEVVRGTATITLDPPTLDRMTDAATRRAFAQIVLTFTSFRTPQGGIGQVLLTKGGEPISVFLPNQNRTSDPNEPIAFEDFANLIDGERAAATTTTTTSTVAGPPPTDAVPPDAVPPDASDTLQPSDAAPPDAAPPASGTPPTADQ